jgi:nicotinamidase/pyrazinamidase
MKALIVVDMQNDFIDGSLAVPGAAEIIVPIQNYIGDLAERWGDEYPLIAFTACAHPADHCSFKEQGGPWPAHCVVGTKGRRLQPGLEAMSYGGCMLFEKGSDSDKEEYSALYEGSPLHDWLKGDAHTENPVTELEICGLARDYCVQATADAAVALGYKVTILEHLCRAVGR